MKYNKITGLLLEKFKKIVGSNFFFNQFEIRWAYSFGGSIFNKDWIPDLILMPQNSRQVSEILKLANKNHIAVTPRGSGTSLSSGSITPYGGIVLDLSQMKKILNIDIIHSID